ncbi:toxin-antitoxin system, antitoxin component [Capnocytophaga cynodegmi]|uniref:toxin-antitoxin system, antitoxin component n=1 Tax=Capnocytophaga cynodegmi TaxID=28189 RepID=UPI00385B4F57
MNVIRLKGNISFEQYQLATKALENIGIEIEEPTLFGDFELSEQEMEDFRASEQEIQKGMGISDEEVMVKLAQRYES